MPKRIKCPTCKKRIQGWKEDVLWQQTNCSRHECGVDDVDLTQLRSRQSTATNVIHLLENKKEEPQQSDEEEEVIPPVLVLNILSPERRLSNVHEFPKNRVLH